MKKVKVHSPGTVANLVCGFDILGMALSEPYDVMEVTLLDEPNVIIHNKDNFDLPTEPEKNVAGVVLLSVMERMNNKVGFEITIEKHIKPGSGIGSSAASAAGAAVAANHLLGNIFSADDKNLAFWGSRGQQRLAVLAIRLAQINYLEKNYQDKPVLLLDDIFSELDPDHQKLVVSLCKNYQTIFTAAEPESVKVLSTAKLIKLT